MLTLLLFSAILFVAFTNGANANFKGVASLYASRTTTFRQALMLGTIMTLLGSIASIFLAQGIMKQFSGRGLVPPELVQSPVFACSVAMGAAWTSFLATRLAFPVSTTHALLGALIGAGLAANPKSVHLEPLVRTFLVPLLISPLLAIAISIPIAFAFKLIKAESEGMEKKVKWIHIASAAGASFARGLNDAPKMAALFLVMPNVSPTIAIVLVAAMITLGGLVDAKNVANTLGNEVAHMNPVQGTIASLVTFGLVSTASLKSLPVSTTHVCVGALLGAGSVTGQAKWRKAVEIFFAWISTVPCGAVLAALWYLCIQAFLPG